MNKILCPLWPNSFRNQLVFGVGSILATLLLAFNYMTIKEEREFLHEQGLKQASNRSLAFAAASKVWLLANDYIGLEEIAENFAIYEDLEFHAIINMDGKILVHTDQSLVGMYISDKVRVEYLKEMSTKDDHPRDEKVLVDNREYIEVIRMVHDGQRHIGMVNVRINQKSRQDNIDKRLIKGLVFTFVSLVAAMLFSVFVVGKMTDQLTNLIKMMKRIREGEKDVRADENTTQEISQLSREFNSMMTALKESEASYDRLNERMELAFESTEDGLWDWNLEDNTVYFSMTWKKLLGYEEDELANDFSSWENNVHPDDLPQAKQDLNDHFEGKTDKYENLHRLRHKDGHWIWNLGRGKVLRDRNGKVIRMVGTNADVSELKRLQEALNEQEELMIAQSRHAAMGEMISMIAHQWRQPISIIAMGANNLLLSAEFKNITEELVREQAESITVQTQYLSKTIGDFRDFFRPNRDKEETMIDEVLEEAISIIGKSLENDSIELVVKENPVGYIKTYSRELLQVFLNILKNSKEALVENTPQDRRINVDIHSDEESVRILICDNGGGIPEEVIEKIFDPYFSTKNEKIGTGLGLYMSKTIIEKHLQGSLGVSSEGGNTCFELILPKLSDDKKA